MNGSPPESLPPAAADAPPGGWPTPRAAYLHVPFCRHRCGYCNFSVVAGRDDLIKRYLAAIDRELARLDRPAVDTVFIGGGTPTHLAPEALERLLSTVRRRLDLSPAAEWSVEANPEDITAEKLEVLQRLGVNRVSLGVQSFHADKLHVLERGHRGDSAAAAIEQTSATIPNVSIDLIFAAPGESLAVWRSDLQRALSLPITHLSTYALTIEKGTSFWSRHRRGELQPASEPEELEMYELARRRAAARGMRQYEISSFAAEGAACQHNLAYWRGRGWYAAGPGAARFVGGRREVNHRSTTAYLRRIETERSPVAESEPISVSEYARERAAFGIRVLEGIDLQQLQQETGCDLRQLCGEAIERSLGAGLLSGDDHRLRLTERGIRFADSVAADLLG